MRFGKTIKQVKKEGDENMKVSILLSALLLSSAVCLPAHAADTWICSYSGLDKEHKPEIMELKVQGNTLRDTHFGWSDFRILQNDSAMLTAAWSEPLDGDTSMVNTIVIQKNTKAFGMSSTTSDGAEFTKGTCIKD
ncbi:MAG: hypothetical protein WCA19_24780 [Candidatus Acidiferrales bacterium]